VGLLQTRQGSLSTGTAALFLCLAAISAPAATANLPSAQVRIFKPACSSTDVSDVAQALGEASALLEARCHLRLHLEGVVSLPEVSDWCHLPPDPAGRALALRRLAADAKTPHPRELALFLLPSDADPRLSWALVDASRRSACDSPQERRFLARFGSFFFTDETWMASLDFREEGGSSRAALLVAHEVLHCLTQRGHPTGVGPGSVMADHVADLGTKIGDDWCACALQSPYLKGQP
jgi:hypothetical protein